MKRLWFIIPFCIVLCGCTNPLRLTLEAVVRDYSTPGTEISFADNSGIAKTTPITITFSETMDTASLTFAGSMATEGAAAWSTTTNANDTLTISPLAEWSPGSGKTLTIDCADLEGYGIDQLAMTYGVLEGVVYVHGTNGNDSNPGTIDLPKKSVQAGIDLTDLLYTTAEVHVAEGQYTSASSNSTFITLKDGISIIGGFSATNWSNRSPSQFLTSIIHNGASGTNLTVTVNQASSATTIDGFTIEAGGGNLSTAVYCISSSPVIENNIIRWSAGADTSYGISVQDESNPVIRNNTITSTGGVIAFGINCQSSNATIQANRIVCLIATSFTAIFLSDSSPDITANSIAVGTCLGGVDDWSCIGILNMSGSNGIIRNNVINAGKSTMPRGIVNFNSAPIIQNNTIFGGENYITGTTNAVAIQNLEGSKPNIDNNIIMMDGFADSRIGIYESDSASVPASMRNNFFYNCADGNYYDIIAYKAYVISLSTFESELNAAGCLTSDNAWSTVSPELNTSVDPITNPNSYFNFTVSSPNPPTGGGKDLSASFTTDKVGTTRTPQWSIGAYEKD